MTGPFNIMPNVISSQLGKERIVLDLNHGLYYSLNSIGGEIWQLIQNGAATERSIINFLEEKNQVCRKRLVQDTIPLIKELKQSQLIK